MPTKSEREHFHNKDKEWLRVWRFGNNVLDRPIADAGWMLSDDDRDQNAVAWDNLRFALRAAYGDDMERYRAPTVQLRTPPRRNLSDYEYEDLWRKY
ncbi:MAG: hypothetical protein KGI50_06245 [Patescibacteria group bacterium]|nr:hypothetical protein [Patescibacteria group bacterium]